ncbi:MAG TPA: hypothetical protein VH881_12675 [Burkholderiales bacterium]|jgi:hypothetical protein
MKIRSIRAGVHRLYFTVPLLKVPIVRSALDDGNRLLRALRN